MPQTKSLFQVETSSVHLAITQVHPLKAIDQHPAHFLPESTDPEKYLSRYSESQDHVPTVRLGGTDVPERFEVVVGVEPKRRSARWLGGMSVVLTAAIGQDGVPRCRKVEVETSPEPSDSVGLEVLRTIPVANLLRIGVQWLVKEGDVDAVLKAWDAYRRPPTLARSNADLKRVAEVVTSHKKAAEDLGTRPNLIGAVQREFGLTWATAARRIRAARQHNYIKEERSNKR